MRKKRDAPQKSEDFIGWKSPDGNLEVIGIFGKQKSNTLFKVTCTECSKDKELFPEGYFISTKRHLLNGSKPCGCSSKPKLEGWQCLILAKRIGSGRFIVHGFTEKFKGVHTRLKLECVVDNCLWYPTISNITSGTGCPECGRVKRKTPHHIVIEKCKELCHDKGYTYIGFPNGHVNQNSRFEYKCPKHGIRNVSYSSFTTRNSGCLACTRELGNGNGYYPERKDEQDFLYVLDFNGKFIKVGRSFDVDDRIKDLKKPTQSGMKSIVKLRIFTATHQEIYDLEQELHNELRERNFQYYVDWSTECFENDSLFVLNKLLDTIGMEEIK